VTGFRHIGGSAVGPKAVYGSGCSNISQPDADNEYAMINSTIVRTHQHSAGAKKNAVEDQAIGRSRGGLSTKIHTLVDALGNPLGFFLTGGEAHDLVGEDHLLPTMAADTRIADRACPCEGGCI
jgi:hypothetical protein